MGNSHQWENGSNRATNLEADNVGIERIEQLKERTMLGYALSEAINVVCDYLQHITPNHQIEGIA